VIIMVGINVVPSGVSYKIDFNVRNIHYDFMISRQPNGMIIFTGGIMNLGSEMRPCIISHTTMDGFEYVVCNFGIRSVEDDKELFDTLSLVLKHIREIYDGRWG
jgi:hypothetical protein